MAEAHLSPRRTLTEEHQRILSVLEALGAYAEHSTLDGEQSRCELLKMVGFFSDYADLLHHEKEECLVLPSLVEAGLAWDQGCLLEIRREHEFERYLTQALRHASQQPGPWTVAERTRVAQLVRRFIDFMRHHIEKEESELLPLLDERLSAPASQRLAAEMSRLDAHQMQNGELAELCELAARLASTAGR